VITPSTGYDHADGARVRPACSSSPFTCSSLSFPSSLPASYLRRTHLRVSSCHRHRSRPCLWSCNRLSSPLARTAPVFIFLTLAVRLRPRLCSRSHFVVSPGQCLTSHHCHLLPSLACFDAMLAVLTPHACTSSHLFALTCQPRFRPQGLCSHPQFLPATLCSRFVFTRCCVLALALHPAASTPTPTQYNYVCLSWSHC
jgi:hypothetical protein